MAFRHARVLLVDDDVEAALVLAGGLRAELPQFPIDVAAGPADALIRLRADAFDVLIADVNMRAMTGAALAERARGLHAGISVVLISGAGERDLLAVARQVGADGWFPKPVDLAALVATLERLLPS